MCSSLTASLWEMRHHSEPLCLCLQSCSGRRDFHNVTLIGFVKWLQIEKLPRLSRRFEKRFDFIRSYQRTAIRTKTEPLSKPPESFVWLKFLPPRFQTTLLLVSHDEGETENDEITALWARFRV